MPSSSLFLRSSTTLVSALSLLSLASAAPAPANTQYYALDTSYQGESFFDGFNFFDSADPTHGYVTYVSRSDAEADHLISYGPGQPAKMSVDAVTALTPPADSSVYSGINGIGRKSVRIESQKRWTHGLIIADISHMPTSSDNGCGTWPAFWTLGSGTWPYNGEVDILEGANDQSKNFAAGHTGSADQTRQCTITNNGGDGDLIYNNCNLYTTDPFGNPTNPTGCKVEDEDANSYGASFNGNDGGVYAMEWTSSAIKIYFFPRGGIPSDIKKGEPDPTNWTPFAVFGPPGCDVDSNFNDMQIIFDTTFCGDFGDATWANTCAATTGFSTCAAYVASKPADFLQAFWEIQSLDVYTLQTKSSTTTSTPTYTGTATTPTSTTTWDNGSFPSGSTTPSGSWSGSWPTDTTPGSDSASTYASWEDWSSTTSTSADPTTTGTWSDWSADPTAKSISTSSYVSWEDWKSTTTTTPYDPSSTWADWETSTTSKDPGTTWADWESTTTSEDPTTTWADWESTTTSEDPTTTWADWESYTPTPSDPSTTWADWESTSTPSDPSSTWADWAASDGSPVVPTTTGMTTVAVWPTASTSAGAAASSGSPVSPASAGWGSGNGTSPWVAQYTGAAAKSGVSVAALLVVGVVALL